MGQGQSSDNAAVDEAPAKADYYDLLGVERNATEDELKKAYRRKALELHPDRNYGNVDHATQLFAEVQTAYEVLSDPQERAWYDSHRDILLRGDGVAGDGSDEFSYNIRMTTAVEVQKLMLKFNGKLEFTDAPSGFYGGLNDFISKLGKEEDIACQWEDEDPMDYPQFGSKDDRYEDVVRPFYAAWTGFATRKSFAWKDQYRLSDAPNRIVRRLMEKENKKIREEAAQEYNDAVRSLVAFVRKRDPRVANNQKSEAERQKILRDAAAAQAARSKAAYQARMKDLDTTNAIPEWAQSRSKDQYEGGFSSESEVEEHEYECVVCDKTFKSDAQFKAHEKSKKHIKQLKQLKRELGRDNIDVVNPDGPKAESEESVEDANDDGGRLEKAAGEPIDNEKDNESHDGGVNDLKASRDVDLSNASSASTDESNDDYASREAVESRLGAANITAVANGLADASLDGTPATSDTEGQTARKVGKAKQKRAKKAAQQQSGAPEKSGSGFNCATCKAEFSSKTKLFDHLKDKPKHAAPILQTKPPRGAKDKKR